MASSTKLSIVLFLACSIFVQETLADVICETLPKHLCSFAIATSGKRCILDIFQNEDGNIDYNCKTSNVMVEKLAGHIENDQCMKVCGIDRLLTGGLSLEGSLPIDFTTSICSAACYHNCPGVVDLFSNIAAGKGLKLSEICGTYGNPHRAMSAISGVGGAWSPTEAPESARSMIQRLMVQYLIFTED